MSKSKLGFQDVAFLPSRASLNTISINKKISVCVTQFLPLPADQRWQVRYQKKAHNQRKLRIIFLRPYNQQVFPYTPKQKPHTIYPLQIGKRSIQCFEKFLSIKNERRSRSIHTARFELSITVKTRTPLIR